MWFLLLIISILAIVCLVMAGRTKEQPTEVKVIHDTIDYDIFIDYYMSENLKLLDSIEKLNK